MTPSPPRIMLIGARGAGLHTQLNRLCSQYKIPVFKLKISFKSSCKWEGKDRQYRTFEKGFKPTEVDEEGKVIEDPEAVDGPGDFDKRAHEIQITKLIFKEIQQSLINENFKKMQLLHL